jgi:hypothetical protein
MPTPVQLVLRSTHTEFLRDLRTKVGAKTLSRTFIQILAAAQERPDFQQNRPTYIQRLHLYLEPDAVEILDALTRKWGITRSAAAQRLIEMVSDGRLPGTAEPAETTPERRSIAPTSAARRRPRARNPRRASRSANQMALFAFEDVG